MSTNIDERVVKMSFDDANLEAGATKAIGIIDSLNKALNFESAASGIDSAQRALNSFSLNNVSSSIEACSLGFSRFGAFVFGIYNELGREALSLGKKMVKGLTVQGAIDGFKEYELQMQSVQTILSNTGDRLKEAGLETKEDQIGYINYKLDELNEYADKTIYNFSQMTRNLGLFTAAGVDLDVATSAIKGLSNLAAASGADGAALNRAMYNISQALSTGTVRLMDWNSVVNAGMGGKLFQDAIKRTARVNGIAVDEIIEKHGSFRASLQENWLTAEVLNETLEQLAIEIGDVGYETEEAGIATLKSKGYTEDQAIAILDLAKNVSEAATQVRTWTQLWQTVGESIGSGWAQTWRIVVGDMLEATDLFTWFSEKITGIVNESNEARNAILEEWAEAGGRDALVETLKHIYEAVEKPLTAIANAFSSVFGISSEQLYNITAALEVFTKHLVISDEAAELLQMVFTDVFTVVHAVVGVFGNATRIVLSFGRVAWAVIKPISELAFLLFGFFADGVSRFGEKILSVTDSIEERVFYFTRSVIGAINGFLSGDLTLSDVFEKIAASFSRNIGQPFLEVLGSLKNKAKTALSSIGEWILNALSGKDLVKRETILTTLNSFVSSLKGFAEAISPVFESIKKGFFSLISGDVPIFDIFNQIGTVFGNLLGPIKEKGKELWSSAKEVVGNLVAGFREGISEKLSEIWEWAQTIGETILTAVKNFLGIQSPSTKFFEIGQNVIQGLVDGLAYCMSWISEKALEIGTSLYGIVSDIAEGIRITVGDIASKVFAKLPAPVQEALRSIKNFVYGFVSRAKELAVGTSFFHELLNQFSRFRGGEGFDFIAVMKSLGSTIRDVFGQIKDSVSKTPIGAMFEQVSSAISGFASSMGITLPTLESISSVLSGLIGSVSSGAETLGKDAGSFLSDLLSKLPSISDIGTSITEFIGWLKDRLFEAIRSAFGDENPLQEQGLFSKILDLSNFSWILPDWKTPVKAFLTDFESVLDLVPDERINELVESFAGWAKKIGGVAFAFSGWKWLGSLTKLNNARANEKNVFAQMLDTMPTNLDSILTNFGKNFAQGLFDPIKAGLGSVGTAIRDFGKAFDPFGKKTLAKQMKDIAAGILLLAGALFVISKIPAEDLERSGKALAQLAGGALIILTVLGVFTALGKIDFSGVGQAFGGLGIGLLAVVGALYVLTRILSNPDLDIDNAYKRLMELMALLTLAVAVVGLTTKDSAMGGAASTLIALSAAMLLAIAPLYILAKVSEKTFTDGMFRIVLLGSVLSFCAAILSSMSSFGSIGGAVVLIALVAALTLALVPMYLLNNVPEALFIKGLKRIGMLGGLLTLLVLMLTNTGSDIAGVIGGTVALLAIVAAVSLMILPITMLGKLDQGAVKQGLIAITVIGVLLAGMVGVLSFIGSSAPGVILGSLGLVLIVGAIGLMAVVLGALSVVAGMNPEGFTSACWGLVAIAAVLGVLAAVLSVVGPAMAIGALSLVGMVVAVGLMAALVVALAYIVDLHPEAMVNAIAALAAILAILAGISIASALTGAGLVVLSVGLIALAGALVVLAGAIALITQVFFPGFFDNLFSSFESGGGNIVGGIVSGIGNAAGLAFEAIVNLASGLFQSFCSWLGIQSPSTVMEGAGENVVQGLINGITGSEDGAFDASQLLGENSINGLLEGFGLKMDEVEGAGEEGSSSFLSGLSDLPTLLGEKGGEALNSFLSQIDTEELKQKGVDMISGLLEGLGENIKEKLAEKAESIFSGLTEPIATFFGIHSPSVYMQEMGANVIQGFVNGLDEDEGILTAAADIGNRILEGIQNLPGLLGTLGSNAMSALGSPFSGGKAEVSGKVKGIVDGASNSAKGLGGKLKGAASSAMSTFSTSIKSGTAGVKLQVTSIVNSASSAVAPLGNKLKSEATKAMNVFSSAIKAGAGSAKSAVASVMSAATSSVKSMYNQFHSTGKNAVQGLIDGINSLIGQARSKAQELMTIVVKASRAKAEIKSPSRVFMRMGEYIVEGLINGMDNLTGDAATAGSDLSGTVVDSFGNSLNGMAIGMDDLLDTDYNPVITPVINSAEFDSNLQQLSAMMNSRLSDSMNIGSVNYNETFAGKLDAVADINKQAMQQFAESAIDYDLLGMSVANALIRSGVHVEMDGGQLMGYLAGEIRDARRMSR